MAQDEKHTGDARAFDSVSGWFRENTDPAGDDLGGMWFDENEEGQVEKPVEVVSDGTI